MELILIRHARPERVEGAAGGADPGLTKAGVHQAEAMAEWMSIEVLDALYVSPMARARETSRPLESVLGMDATVVPEVREFDAEDPSYIPLEDLRADKEQWKSYVASEGVSDRSEFFDAVNRSLTEIVARHRGERVVVVCHGGVINAYASSVLGLPPRLFFNPDYTSINRFMIASSGDRSVRSLNDIGHLRPHPHLILR
ncbi:MAG: histidine phosphatase family protein [Acidimicrobiales bacterium]